MCKKPLKFDGTEHYEPPIVTIVEVSVERGFAATLPDHGINPW